MHIKMMMLQKIRNARFEFFLMTLNEKIKTKQNDNKINHENGEGC